MIKIKKVISILAIVLLMSQVITVLPVYAEEGVVSQERCFHNTCKNHQNGDGYNGLCNECNSAENYSYVSNNDGKSHTVNDECQCGYKNTYTDNCVPEDGICRSCYQPIAYDYCCHKECNNYKEGYYSYCSKCNFNKDKVISNEDGITHAAYISCDGCPSEFVQNEDCYFVDGYCQECKQPQKYMECIHPGCNNSIAGGRTLCEKCSGYWEITYRWVTFDENTHQEYIWYPCCKYDYATGKLGRHGFEDTGNGKRCRLCRYALNGSLNDSDNENYNEKAESNSTNNTVESRTENNITESIPNSTVISNGKQISSSVTTINISTLINGVAVVTSKQEIRNAVGITNEETNTSFYVCNNDNSVTKRIINSTLKDKGKTVYNIFNADMYSITKDGKIEKIHSIDNPITLIFGIPAELQNKKVSIVAYNNKTGEYVEFQDVDNDSKTITIDATVFGIYALVVEND